MGVGEGFKRLEERVRSEDVEGKQDVLGWTRLEKGRGLMVGKRGKRVGCLRVR